MVFVAAKNQSRDSWRLVGAGYSPGDTMMQNNMDYDSIAKAGSMLVPAPSS